MLERNKVPIDVFRGTVYSLLVGDRAVSLSGTPLQTAMNALGPQRCMIEIARTIRATLRRHACACGASEAAAQQLPETFYGIGKHAVAFECEGESDPVSVTRISLTVPHPTGMYFIPTSHVPATCATRLQTVSLGVVRSPLGIGS